MISRETCMLFLTNPITAFLISSSDRNAVLVMAAIALLIIIIARISYIEDFIKRRLLFIKDLSREAIVRSVDFAPYAVISIDEDGKVVAWNRQAELMFEYSKSEMVGKTLLTILPHKYREMHSKALNRAKITGENKIVGQRLLLEGLTKKGKEFPISLTISRWEFEDSIFYTGIIKDNSAAIEERQNFQKQICLLEHGESISKHGTWEWDIIEDIVYTTPEFNRIFDWDTTHSKAQDLLARVCKEDRDRINECINRAVYDSEDFETQFCLVCKDGSRLQIESKVRCTVLDDMTYRLNGTVRVVETNTCA